MMDTATTTTATGSDCLAELRKGGSGFSWNGFSPSGVQLSTIDRNEDNQAQQSKSLCLVVLNRRPRTKRCRRSAFSPRRSIPPLFEPKNSPNSRLIKQQRKKLKQLYPLNPMEKSNSSSTKCTHCGVTDTPQWRAGPLGPRTLCNACGVRYKSGRLLPEYRPAASPYFSPTLHSNSHKKVLEMRNKPDNMPYRPDNGPYADNCGTELAAEDIKCSEKVRNKIVECYNEDTMTEVPVGGESKEVVVPYVGFLDSPDNVLQRRDDDEEFFEYFFDGIEDNDSMDLIPNIDPLYGLDLSEYCLGDHSLDFTF